MEMDVYRFDAVQVCGHCRAPVAVLFDGVG
jgi:hypothetical protein